MAIRGRIKQETKDRMIEMAAGEYSVEEIAEETGASEKQVTSVLESYAASQADEGEEVDASYVEVGSAEFWKGRYLDAHAKLVENNLA